MPLKTILTDDHKRLLREAVTEANDAEQVFHAAGLLGRDVQDALQRCQHCRQMVEDVMEFDRQYSQGQKR